MKPVSDICNKAARTHREVRIRPIKESGLCKLKSWKSEYVWSEIIEEESIDRKAELLQDIVMSKVNIFLPEKNKKNCY